MRGRERGPSPGVFRTWASRPPLPGALARLRENKGPVILAPRHVKIGHRCEAVYAQRRNGFYGQINSAEARCFDVS